jgi:hypothetical protein
MKSMRLEITTAASTPDTTVRRLDIASPKVTLNGAPPTKTCSSAPPAAILLKENTHGYSLSIQVPCEPTFPFSGEIYPGTYTVSVAGNSYSNLPQGTPFVVYRQLEIR